ncbi:MAG: FG-GAP repeat domain-containing protein [Microcoleus sp.]
MGDGTGNFDTANNFSVINGGAGYPASVVAGDFNGDGKLDLATSDSYYGSLSFLSGDGTGKFGTPSKFTIPSLGNFDVSMIARDFNADGKLDIATAYSQNLSILLNTSNTVNYRI